MNSKITGTNFVGYLVIFSLLFMVALIGLMPHLVFSWEVGELAFFKSAFDEDTYFLLLSSDQLGVSRFLSRVAMQLLSVISGENPDITLIAADVIFPVLVAASAWFLAGAIFSAPMLRFFLTFALLFAGDFLSFANGAVWPGTIASLHWLRALFGPYGAMLVPAADASYLNLFRTPEPQISYSVTFLALGAAVRLAQAEHGRSAVFWYRSLLLASTATAAICYVFLSVPLMLFLVGAAVVSSLGRRFMNATFFALAAGLAGSVLAWQNGSTGASLVFGSRMPVFTPAVLFSLVGATVMVIAMARRNDAGIPQWLALGLILMPAVLCNQQLLTGIMVSTRDWERYANFPFLVLGIAWGAQLFVVEQGPENDQRRKANKVPGLLVLCCYVVIVVVQARAYAIWLPQNLHAESAARVVWLAVDEAGGQPRILFDDATIAPNVAVRTGGIGVPVLDYTQLFQTPILPMDAAGNLAPNTYNREALFEYWARMNLAPSKAEEILLQEASAQSGFFSGFLFNFLDFWYPASDSRKVRAGDVARHIPAIISQYADTLTNMQKACNAMHNEPVLFVSKDLPPATNDAGYWSYELVAEAAAGNYRSRAYLQRAPGC